MAPKNPFTAEPSWDPQDKSSIESLLTQEFCERLASSLMFSTSNLRTITLRLYSSTKLTLKVFRSEELLFLGSTSTASTIMRLLVLLANWNSCVLTWSYFLETQLAGRSLELPVSPRSGEQSHIRLFFLGSSASPPTTQQQSFVNMISGMLQS